MKNDPARREAKVTFAEDVASFANVSGGVLIIGVNDKREVVGIGKGGQLENRLKFARDVIAEHVEYDREIASFRQVAVGEKGNEKICLIVVVSQACEAVAVSDGRGHYSYPVRRETGITRVRPDDENKALALDRLSNWKEKGATLLFAFTAPQSKFSIHVLVLHVS